MVEMNWKLPDEFSIQKFLDAKIVLDNQSESYRLAQPKAAYEFLSNIKEIVDEGSGEGEFQLPGLVQVFHIFNAVGEFFPDGHFKQVIARVLFEDGVTRNIRGYEHFAIGTSGFDPKLKAGIDIIPEPEAPAQDGKAVEPTGE